ncbi:MAG: hypothetical protein IIC20_00205, partial [Chloroflexi bacterium]|nr:hypothetical protein [Chloroflexota bacterium]
MVDDIRWKPPSYSVNTAGKIVGFANAEPNNWGKWGDDDQRGTTNYITAETVHQAAGLVNDHLVGCPQHGECAAEAAR